MTRIDFEPIEFEPVAPQIDFEPIEFEPIEEPTKPTYQASQEAVQRITGGRDLTLDQVRSLRTGESAKAQYEPMAPDYGVKFETTEAATTAAPGQQVPTIRRRMREAEAELKVKEPDVEQKRKQAAEATEAIDNLLFELGHGERPAKEPLQKPGAIVDYGPVRGTRTRETPPTPEERQRLGTLVENAKAKIIETEKAHQGLIESEKKLRQAIAEEKKTLPTARKYRIVAQTFTTQPLRTIGHAMAMMGMKGTGNDVAKAANRFEENYLRVYDPTITEQLLQGVASTATFAIPGAGVMKAAQAATVAPRVAAILGTTTAAAFEAMQNAGSVRDQLMQSGKYNERQATNKAWDVFWTNLPLNAVLDKWMFADLQGGKGKVKQVLEAIKSGTGQEAVQEGLQQLIEEVAVKDTKNWSVVDAAERILGSTAMGGAVGGLMGGGRAGLQVAAAPVERPSVAAPIPGAEVLAKGERMAAEPTPVSRETQKPEQLQKLPDLTAEEEQAMTRDLEAPVVEEVKEQTPTAKKEGEAKIAVVKPEAEGAKKVGEIWDYTVGDRKADRITLTQKANQLIERDKSAGRTPRAIEQALEDADELSHNDVTGQPSVAHYNQYMDDVRAQKVNDDHAKLFHKHGDEIVIALGFKDEAGEQRYVDAQIDINKFGAFNETPGFGHERTNFLNTDMQRVMVDELANNEAIKNAATGDDKLRAFVQTMDEVHEIVNHIRVKVPNTNKAVNLALSFGISTNPAAAEDLLNSGKKTVGENSIVLDNELKKLKLYDKQGVDRTAEYYEAGLRSKKLEAEYARRQEEANLRTPGRERNAGREEGIRGGEGRGAEEEGIEVQKPAAKKEVAPAEPQKPKQTAEGEHQQDWGWGRKRPFQFDPRTGGINVESADIKKEHSFRIVPPPSVLKSIDPERAKMVYPEGTKWSRKPSGTQGIEYLGFTPPGGKWTQQTIRFAPGIIEEQAAEWWKKNQDKFEFYKGEVGKAPIETAKEKAAKLKPVSKPFEAVKPEKPAPTIKRKQEVLAMPSLPPAAIEGTEAPDPLLPSNQIDIGTNIGSMEDRIKEERPVQVNKVIEAIGKIVEVPMRVGRFRQKALGIYKAAPQVIRTKTAMDVTTAAHEMGHALHYIVLDKQKYTGKAAKELVKLGMDLYGETKPNGGYQLEGFAEYVSQYLNGIDVEKTYPEFTKEWKVFLGKEPKIAEAVENAKQTIAKYGLQGAIKRGIGRIEFGKSGPGVGEAIKKYASAKYIYEELQPFYDFDKAVEKALGRKLRKSESPYEIAQRLKYTHEARMRYMVEHGMMDLAGNITGGSLKDAVALTGEARKDFTVYLYARRAIERHEKGKNPGISLKDAKYIVEQLDSEAFRIAAQKVYDWNNGVLNYVVQADPAFKPIIDKIHETSYDYVPLQRVFEDIEDGYLKSKAVKGGNPLRRMKGSGRRIRDPFGVMVENAVKLIRQAHQKRILNTMVQWADLPGMGHVIEKVPKDMVPTKLQMQELVKAIEKKVGNLGVEIKPEDMEDAITTFTPAMQYKGKDPILPFVTYSEDGKKVVTWYQLDNELFETLSGLDQYRLPVIFDVIFGTTTRALRIGTTGMRAAFALVRNPQRDLGTILIQTQKKGNPLTLIPYWMKNNLLGFGYQLWGAKSPYHDLFVRLGGEMSQYMGQDTREVRRAVQELFGNKYVNWIKHPVARIRDVFQIPELASRVTEIEAVAKQIGWKPGDPLTFDQSLELLGAGQDVSTNFGAAGKFSKIMNQMVPFFNSQIQGQRTFGRNFKRRPLAMSIRAISLLTIPTLLLWWQNKDKEWYKQMPWYEKFSKWSFEEGEYVFQLLRPFDWGNAFSALPEALVDAAYQKNPEEVKEAFKYIFENTRPGIVPQTLLPVAEQLANKQFYTGRPIVKMADERRPQEEQYDDYTTELAKMVGKITGLSPYRIDHFIRAYFGGLGGDIAAVFDPPKKQLSKGIESVPLVNQLVRRGGVHGKSRKISQVFEEYSRVITEKNSKNEERKNDPIVVGKYYMLKEATQTIKVYNDLLKETEDPKHLKRIRDNINKLADDVLNEIEDERKVRIIRIANQMYSSKKDIRRKTRQEFRDLPDYEKKLVRDEIREKERKRAEKRKRGQ